MFAVILTFCTPCAAQEANVGNLLAQAEPRIQERISSIVDSLHQLRVDPRSNILAFREAQLLIESVTDHGEIVKQVAIFAVTPTGEEQQPLIARVVLEVLDLPPKIIIRVLAPYLDADNGQLRSFVRDWFQSHDSGGSGSSALDPVNYRDYRDYVCRRLNTKQEVPQAFIEYLYERSPERALLVFYRADGCKDMVARLMDLRRQQEQHQAGQDQDEPAVQPEKSREEKIRQRVKKEMQKEILLAEHIVSNVIWLKKNNFGEEFYKALPAAKQQLSKLAEQEQWWVRLYVVEIMRRHRELRLADVLGKLSRDSNVLVRNSANSTAD